MIYLQKITAYPQKKEKKKALIFLTNCNAKNNRLEFANELDKYYDVDFFGSCFTNIQDLPRDAQYSKEMRRFIGNYKFFLSFENSNCYDYVTEKYFRTLSSCVIPIVLGPPNIMDFEPLPETIISTKDKTPLEIANLMKKIDDDDKLFEHYLRWKDVPKNELNPHFLHLWEKDITGGAYCDLCKLAHEKPKQLQAKPLYC